MKRRPSTSREVSLAGRHWQPRSAAIRGMAMPARVQQRRGGVRCEKREDAAVRGLLVVSPHQAVEAHAAATIAPDFGDPHRGEDGKALNGGRGDVNFDDQFRWRILAEVNRALAADYASGGEIEGRIRFEALPQVVPLESRGAG